MAGGTEHFEILEPKKIKEDKQYDANFSTIHPSTKVQKPESSLDI